MVLRCRPASTPQVDICQPIPTSCPPPPPSLPSLQANQRILDAAADRLGVPSERVVSNLAEYGNTSAASIPLALDEAVRRGDVKPGQVLALAGFGAGLTWASAIVRWQ
jgi:3-oxoacyl-[acyl-carrier-protein] synthase III